MPSELSSRTYYRIQHWPDMPGDGGDGDAIVFSNDWPDGDWQRLKSWHEAWDWLGGNTEPGDLIEVLPPMSGHRDDSYTPR